MLHTPAPSAPGEKADRQARPVRPERPLRADRLLIPEKFRNAVLMGLSADPEKRARSLANLQLGGQAAIQRHGAQGHAAGVSDEPAPAATPAREGLPVVDYAQPIGEPPAPEQPPIDDDQEPAEHQEPLGDVVLEDEHRDEDLWDDEDDELSWPGVADERPRRGGLGGFVDEFLGR